MRLANSRYRLHISVVECCRGNHGPVFQLRFLGMPDDGIVRKHLGHIRILLYV